MICKLKWLDLHIKVSQNQISFIIVQCDLYGHTYYIIPCEKNIGMYGFLDEAFFYLKGDLLKDVKEIWI